MLIEFVENKTFDYISVHIKILFVMKTNFNIQKLDTWQQYIIKLY